MISFCRKYRTGSFDETRSYPVYFHPHFTPTTAADHSEEEGLGAATHPRQRCGLQYGNLRNSLLFSYYMLCIHMDEMYALIKLFVNYIFNDCYCTAMAWPKIDKYLLNQSTCIC